MNVLIIDDDQDHLDSISEALVLNGIKTKKFLNPLDAIEAYKLSEFDAVITDIKMPQMDGLELLKKLLANDPHAFVVIMTGYPYPGDAAKMLDNGAYAFFHKPLDIYKVIDILSQIEKQIKENRKRKISTPTKEVSKNLSRKKR